MNIKQERVNNVYQTIKEQIKELNADKVKEDDLLISLMIFRDLALGIYDSSLQLKEKKTPTIEDYLIEVEGFNLSDTQSYIEEYNLNFVKYNRKYKQWLKNL